VTFLTCSQTEGRSGAVSYNLIDSEPMKLMSSRKVPATDLWTLISLTGDAVYACGLLGTPSHVTIVEESARSLVSFFWQTFIAIMAAKKLDW